MQPLQDVMYKPRPIPMTYNGNMQTSLPEPRENKTLCRYSLGQGGEADLCDWEVLAKRFRNPASAPSCAFTPRNFRDGPKEVHYLRKSACILSRGELRSTFYSSCLCRHRGPFVLVSLKLKGFDALSVNTYLSIQYASSPWQNQCSCMLYCSCYA